MNPKIKARWLKALRSDRYKQATGALRKDGDFCCLGVLCDLARRSKIGKWDGGRFGYADSVLPTTVVVWAGLSDANPSVEIGDGEARRALSWLNDSGHTFEQIANYIERSL